MGTTEFIGHAYQPPTIDSCMALLCMLKVQTPLEIVCTMLCMKLQVQYA